MTTFAYASSKLGSKIKPETKAKAQEIFYAAQAAGHDIWFMWGIGTSAEHSTGRALDLMVKTHAAGQFVRDYIWKNRARLRLQHVIWEQKITSTVTRPGVVRKMADRGTTTKNHFDHVHVLFLTGAYVAPGKPADPKPSPKPPVPGGKKSNDVVAAEVVKGEWGNGDARIKRLKQAGYNPAVIQVLVNKILRVQPKKSVTVMAREVIAGKWGNGDARKQKLKAAGYDYNRVQAEVNRLVG